MACQAHHPQNMPHSLPCPRAEWCTVRRMAETEALLEVHRQFEHVTMHGATRNNVQAIFLPQGPCCLCTCAQLCMGLTVVYKLLYNDINFGNHSPSRRAGAPEVLGLQKWIF